MTEKKIAPVGNASPETEEAVARENVKMKAFLEWSKAPEGVEEMRRRALKEQKDG